jgi:hypothetical protein
MGTIVNTSWVVPVVLGLAVAGCQVSPEAVADPVGFNLDGAFTLRGGQEAASSDENLRLRFTDVLEDSRCPTQVDCAWAGQARIAILVEPAGREPTTTEFITNPAGQNNQTAEVGGYTIWLQSLDPYPQTADQSIALDEYGATLLVQLTS